MGLLESCRDLICQMLVGESVTAFDESNAYVGVGDDNTAYAASQTDLLAVTNKVRIAMDSGFPTRSDNVMTFQGTAGSAVANFEWLEFIVANASSGGVAMNRVVASKGTKASGEIWVLKIENTLTIGS
jgi:hypothetical protein